MSVLALLDSYVYVGGHDFTTDSNASTLSNEVAALDKTTFGSGGWTELHGGLKSVQYALSGFWQSAEADAVDPEVFGNLGVVDRVCTIGPEEIEGSTAYLFQAGHFNYQMFSTSIGELAPFSVTCYGTNGVGVVRGQLAKARGAVSATGALGTGLQLGAVGASQYMYATLHVLGTPGTTITAVVESDDANTFASATTRATIGPITTAGGTWATRVAGAITDTWWRFRVTAITGTFTVAGAIAVQ